MRRRLRPVGAFAWALAIVVMGAALYAGYRAAPGLSPFVLETIRIEGNERTSAEDVIGAAGLRTGMTLFGVDVGAVRRALEQLPWVRRARVMRQIPSTLTLSLEEWAPRYLVRLDRLYYLTEEGHVVRAPLDQGLDYAVVTGLSWANLEGDGPLRTALLELLAMLDRGELGEEPSEIHADPAAGFTLYTPSNGGTGIQIGLSEFEEKFRRLARLRRHLERRKQAAYAVDLTCEGKIVARLLPSEGRDSRP